MAFTGQEFVTLTEKTMLYLIIIDKEGKVHYANKRSETLFQLPNDQIVGKSIIDFIIDQEENEFEEIISKCCTLKSPQNYTFRFSPASNSGILTLKFDFILYNDLIYASGIDITEENKEHYSLISLSKLTKTGAWYYNPISEEMFFSKECYNLHDLEPGTPITMEKAISYYRPESRAKIWKYLEDLINKKPTDYTEKIITEKGTEKWIRVLGEPIIHNNKVVFINGSFADITERHNYLEKLKYNEETKHLALKGIRSGLFDHHFDIDATYYSKDFKKMLGLPLEKDFIDVNLLKELIHPDDIEPALKRHIKGLKKEGNHYFNHYRIKNKEGDYRYYEIHGYRKKDKNNWTTRMIGNLIDVHQRKLNEHTIAENHSRLLAMINNSFAYTVLLNTNGEILMADENSLKVIKRDFNINPTDAPTLFIDVMPVNFRSTFAHEFNEALKGNTVKKEIERITYKGAIQWLESKYTPIKNEEHNINSVLVSFHDITEQKTAEIAIKEAHLKEQELSNLKSNILSNFSHEIRTPLNGIITISNLLLSGEENPEEREKLSVYLDESKERLLATINNLSHYSEIETIQKNLNYSETDINYTVETSYRNYRHLAKAKNLTYTLKLDESCPSTLIDEEIFLTAINNIIHNSIKYTDEGKIVVKIKSKKLNIRISIKDTGIGIEKDSLKKIFDPFIQESIGLSRKYEGTGIGLSLSKRYIEVLGGKIKVASKVNKGTEFIITIPKNI
ncbi:PAS domain-containing sensor histidine kinase [Aquimarina sp. 2201CG14-23]|uniref:PAS domain-containing sensor histidine kinase n=1 Tax=Aquimarina mycalae TaxID=3040073 RepID=UPI00247809E7|nr:PAS domain S-box protein [Aquimarina sp. 2201CG14-23]MDH7446821.1 PAS domain S-box protein [Aquimarina sp. 2201CG14-23]